MATMRTGQHRTFPSSQSGPSSCITRGQLGEGRRGQFKGQESLNSCWVLQWEWTWFDFVQRTYECRFFKCEIFQFVNIGSNVLETLFQQNNSSLLVRLGSRVPACQVWAQRLAAESEINLPEADSREGWTLRISRFQVGDTVLQRRDMWKGPGPIGI